MPSLITHYLCGEKSMEALHKCPAKEIIDRHRQVFNLGTQGPDIFFFYNFFTLTHNRRVGKIGSLMHKNKVGAFFRKSLKFIKYEAGYDRELLTSYLLGFICHYTLDCASHPYIYYKAGFQRRCEPATHKYSFYHHKFEKIIDFLMLENIKGIHPEDMEVHNLIKVDKNEAYTIAKMYENILPDVYGTIVKTDDIIKSIDSMVCIHKLLRDRRGVKIKLLLTLKKCFYWPQLALSYMYPKSVPDGPDYLNIKHVPWCLPWNNTAVRTYSFNDMFGMAALESKKLYETVYSYINNDTNIEYAAAKIGNRSYSTGEDCGLDLEFKYHDCIFEPRIIE